MKNLKITEQGQVLIILAAGIVVFLGFAALAIDMGMVYSDRRHAQNTADTSSLAGARVAGDYFEAKRIRKETWKCSTMMTDIKAKIIAAASNRSADNGIQNVDADFSDDHGVDVRCVQGSSNYIDIETILTVDTRTTFSHFIFGGPLRNTVRATARVKATQPIFDGFAIVALNHSNCVGQQGVSFGGDAIVEIDGGGIYSNGCMDGDGNSFSVDVICPADDSTCNRYGSPGDNLGHISPAPQPGDGITESTINPPKCDGLTPRNSPANSGEFTLLPGRYSKTIKSVGGKITFSPGLYCLEGTPNGMDISANTILYGDDVTFRVTKGDVKISGGEEVKLLAPTAGTTSGAIPYLLFYVDVGDIALSGNSSSLYFGTIYVPNGAINITGTSDLGDGLILNTQLIGYNVKIAGTARIDINYQNENALQDPPKLDLQK